jgi:Fic family protein
MPCDAEPGQASGKCSQDTAHRDITDLIERGALKKNPDGGRSTSYSLVVEG